MKKNTQAKFIPPERNNMEDRWLSVEEIAKYLGVSTDTVYIWFNKKSMPGHRAGKLWKFKARDVDKWVKSGKAKETSKPARVKRSKNR